MTGRPVDQEKKVETSYTYRVFFVSLSAELRAHRASVTAAAIATDRRTTVPNGLEIPGNPTLSEPWLLAAIDDVRSHGMQLVQASRQRTLFGIVTSFEKFLGDVARRCFEIDGPGLVRDGHLRLHHGRAPEQELEHMLRHESHLRLAERLRRWVNAGPFAADDLAGWRRCKATRNSIAHRGWQVSTELAAMAGINQPADHMLILSDQQVMETYDAAIKLASHLDAAFLGNVVRDLDAQSFVPMLQRSFADQRDVDIQRWLAEFLGADRSLEWVRQNMRD